VARRRCSPAVLCFLPVATATRIVGAPARASTAAAISRGAVGIFARPVAAAPPGRTARHSAPRRPRAAQPLGDVAAAVAAVTAGAFSGAHLAPAGAPRAGVSGAHATQALKAVAVAVAGSVCAVAVAGSVCGRQGSATASRLDSHTIRCFSRRIGGRSRSLRVPQGDFRMRNHGRRKVRLGLRCLMQKYGSGPLCRVNPHPSSRSRRADPCRR
jgi:hypothetical protein